jgi:transcriptional regulator with XRE-family HTH domain
MSREISKRSGLPVRRERIHEYESDRSEPPLIALLAYARLANVSTDLLIDDQQDLPSAEDETPLSKAIMK